MEDKNVNSVNVKDNITDGSIILISLSCFNNDSTVINTANKGCNTFLKNGPSGSKFDQQVDAVVYVIVVLAIYTSAMVALLIKCMKKEENNSGYLVNYYRNYAKMDHAASVENPQTENKERLRETQKVLQRLYGSKWVYLYDTRTPPAEVNYTSEDKQTILTGSQLVHSNLNRNYTENVNLSTAFVSNSFSYSNGTPCSNSSLNLSPCYCDSDEDSNNSGDGMAKSAENDKDGKFDTDVITLLSRSDSGFLSQSESCHSVQSLQEISEDMT